VHLCGRLPGKRRPPEPAGIISLDAQKMLVHQIMTPRAEGDKAVQIVFSSQGHRVEVMHHQEMPPPAAWSHAAVPVPLEHFCTQ
jgi:hypothetical protein